MRWRAISRGALLGCLRIWKGRRHGEASLSVGTEFGSSGTGVIRADPARPEIGNYATPQRPRCRPLLAPWQVSLSKSLMRQRLESSVTMSDIALNCRLSVSYFERAFANSVGISPYAWLLEQRLMQAKDFLRIPSMPIAHIALDCGFTDQAHFTNTFSRKVGMTPGVWRNKHSPPKELQG